MDNFNENNRLAIFFFYDKDGKVDRYIPNMLEDLCKNISELLVVVNGKLSDEGENEFRKFTPNILVRDNKGFDVWAYKAGMEFYGWYKLNTFDEIILMNFTNFGPVYPFKDMFDYMSERDIDFWGITKHHGHNYDPYNRCKYGYIPEHIQSSFIAVRKNMVDTDDFRGYWNDMPEINGYEDSICYHEAVFTEYFIRKGYKSEVYVNTDDMKDRADYPLMIYPVELIKNRRCPIFKRKSFYNLYEEFLDVSVGEPTFELYRYLKEETDYNLDFIWESILRTANMYDIKQRMQLNYVLPTDIKKPKKVEQPKVALFMHIYFIDMIEYCKKYADNMPLYADIYITTSSEEKRVAIEKAFADFNRRKVKVILIDNRGREYSGLYIAFKQYYDKYDYVCVSHSKKSGYDKPLSIGESFAYHCFENTLASRDFIENVIATFEENPRLGLLVPPTVCHSTYYYIIGREWQFNFVELKQTAKEWGIDVDIADTKPPVAPLGGFYWCRPNALKLIYDRNFKYEDFPEEPCKTMDGTIMHTIERIYPFVAQNAGYYTGWVLSDTYSKLEITNLYKMLRDANETMFWSFGIHDRHTLLSMVASAKNPIDVICSDKTAWEKSKILVRTLLGTKFYEYLKACRNKLNMKKGDKNG